LIETHISWVLLTGEYAYKIKKPVDFGFLDFSTLQRRRHFCQEELRLNRRFAEMLYVDVVAITRDRGAARIGGDGEVIEYAVRMRQFPSEMQLDRLLASGQMLSDELAQFGEELARVHAALPQCDASSAFGTAAAVLAPVRENFAQIRQSRFAAISKDVVGELEAWSERAHAALAAVFEQRRRDGYVRECHGDLHLSNLVRLGDATRAFDCIEFSESLRWIDVISDAAFLVMDCAVRARSDLAFTFLDAYLERTGDYQGGALLGFYLVYRSMVRAKVAALQAQRTDDAPLQQRFLAHLQFARDRALRPRAVVVLMCGLSGSGKSWIAQRLVQTLPGMRIRSDVERKRLADLSAQARTGSPVDSGLYSAQRTAALYDHLMGCAAALARGGERVIVDATFLTRTRRDAFRAAAAQAGAACVVVHCVAPRAVLEARIELRRAQQQDPSEATIEVLDAQTARYEAPDRGEGALIGVDTSMPIDLIGLADQIISTNARR
jgi:aminoglycoside phosphotransferase family enzyme/predicted kinase